MMTKARRHRKKFLLYCLYAWGLSFLVSILAIDDVTRELVNANYRLLGKIVDSVMRGLARS